MKLRFHRLAALVALVAFSGYFAGTVVAAHCSSAAFFDAVTVGAQADGHGDHAAPRGHAADDSHAPESGAPAGPSHDGHCPLGMSGPTCVPASLPGTVARVAAAPAGAEAAFIPSQVGIELLLTQSLYHPPRA